MLALASDLAERPRLAGIRPEMALANQVVAAVFAARGFDCVITSGTEGQHRTQMHPEGRAFDYRLRGIVPDADQDALARDIQARLGPDFMVAVERPPIAPNHLHVGFSPKP